MLLAPDTCRVHRVLLVMVVACFACSDAPNEERTNETDSAGVRIISSSAAETPIWQIGPAPELELGVVEGDEPYRFDRITAAYRLRDGRIVVADGGSSQIRYFDSRGRYLHTSGRRGDGPGEFQVLTSVLKLAGDSILVFDIRNSRVTVLGPAGTIDQDDIFTTPHLSGFGSLRGVLFGDRLLLISTPMRFADGYGRDTVIVLTAQRGSAVADMATRVPSSERIHKTTQTDRGMHSLSTTHPFGYRAVVAAWNDRIVTGTGESFELRLYSPSGELEAIIRRSDAVPLPLEGEVLEQYLASMEAAGIPRQNTLAAFEGYPGPRFVPAYSTLAVDDVQMLWVADYVPNYWNGRSASLGWTVINAGGRVSARAFMPQGFEPLHIGNTFVVGRIRDDADVQYVRVYPLRRSQMQN